MLPVWETIAILNEKRRIENSPPVDSSGYARPRTRGELRDLLNSDVACEVVTSNAMFTAQMLQGWLNFSAFSVRPSENEGWSVFERA